MSRTTTTSGSVSCTDKLGGEGFGFYKIFMQTLSRPAKRYQHLDIRSDRALTSTGSNLAVQASKEVRSSRLRLPPASIVYWLRLGFGVLAGTVYNLIGFGQLGVGLGTLGLFSVGVGLYSVSIIIVKNILGYGPDVLKGPNKHVTLGIGVYIIWMVFTTILLNTVLNSHPS